jgi:hypothetical protein
MRCRLGDSSSVVSTVRSGNPIDHSRGLYGWKSAAGTEMRVSAHVGWRVGDEGSLVFVRFAFTAHGRNAGFQCSCEISLGRLGEVNSEKIWLVRH